MDGIDIKRVEYPAFFFCVKNNIYVCTLLTDGRRRRHPVETAGLNTQKDQVGLFQFLCMKIEVLTAAQPHTGHGHGSASLRSQLRYFICTDFSVLRIRQTNNDPHSFMLLWTPRCDRHSMSAGHSDNHISTMLFKHD